MNNKEGILKGIKNQEKPHASSLFWRNNENNLPPTPILWGFTDAWMSNFEVWGKTLQC